MCVTIISYPDVFSLAFSQSMATIISIMIKTMREIIDALAARAKTRRLALNLTQAGLELRSGVSLGTIKLFERTGKISLESLVKITIALGVSDDFGLLFVSNDASEPRPIAVLLKEADTNNTRKRGRIT